MPTGYVKNINEFAVVEAMRLYAVHCTMRGGKAYSVHTQQPEPLPTWADMGHNHAERTDPKAIRFDSPRYPWYCVALDVMARHELVAMSAQPIPAISSDEKRSRDFDRFMGNRPTIPGISPIVGREPQSE